MADNSYDIHTLPEGTLLYEESSVKSVSQAIRALTGKNTLYSHTDQPDAIRNLGKIIYPFFVLGPGSGGMGCSGGYDTWNNLNGMYHCGPIFPNILYNFGEQQKNLNIIFKISTAESGNQIGAFHAMVGVGGYRFYVEYQSNVTKIRVDGAGASYDYAPNDECKICVDTFQKKISMYINDILMFDNLAVSDTSFTKNSTEVRDYINNIDFCFPSYAEDPGTNDGRGWHTCEIKYFRMEMEDW